MQTLILGGQLTDEIINEANEKKLAQEREYDRVRLEVTRFKSDVLNLYRSHVESLSRLPEFQKEEPAEDAPAEDEAAAADTTAAAVTEEIAGADSGYYRTGTYS